jgi:hypothetical protein
MLARPKAPNLDPSGAHMLRETFLLDGLRSDQRSRFQPKTRHETVWSSDEYGRNGDRSGANRTVCARFIALCRVAAEGPLRWTDHRRQWIAADDVSCGRGKHGRRDRRRSEGPRHAATILGKIKPLMSRGTPSRSSNIVIFVLHISRICSVKVSNAYSTQPACCSAPRLAQARGGHP